MFYADQKTRDDSGDHDMAMVIFKITLAWLVTSAVLAPIVAIFIRGGKGQARCQTDANSAAPGGLK